MTMIISPVPAIENLRIEPWPTNRTVQGARVTRVGRTVVGVTESGRAYSTQVNEGYAYTITCDLDDTLKGLLRLGAISKADYKKHEDARVLANARRSRRSAAESMEWAAKEIGARLTNAQLGAIARAKAGK